jgi:hypothetical protein
MTFLAMAIIVALGAAVGVTCFSVACDTSASSSGPVAGSTPHHGMDHGGMDGYAGAMLQFACDSMVGATALAQKSLPPDTASGLLALLAVVAVLVGPLVPRPTLNVMASLVPGALWPPGDLRGVRLLI